MWRRPTALASSVMTSRSAVNNGTLLAAVTPTETQHLHPDHLGSPRLITGPGGAYRAYHAYHPFGTEATAFNQDTERMKFTGHERDLGNTTSTADDLDYMHARYYNMQNGRFLRADPRPQWEPLRSPVFWNRYSYTANNPLKYSDPNGECAVPAGLAEGQVGICIEAFIAARRIGGIGLGDGRSFAANDPDATARVSLRMLVDPTSGEILDESLRAGTSDIGFSKSLSLGREGTAQLFKTQFDLNGSMNLMLLLTGQNGFEGIANLGSISVLAHLSIDKNGQVTIGPDSSTKGFPSVEGYAYHLVNGVLIVTKLFKHTEQDPKDLKGRRDRPLRSSCDQASPDISPRFKNRALEASTGLDSARRRSAPGLEV